MTNTIGRCYASDGTICERNCTATLFRPSSRVLVMKTRPCSMRFLTRLQTFHPIDHTNRGFDHPCPQVLLYRPIHKEYPRSVREKVAGGSAAGRVRSTRMVPG